MCNRRTNQYKGLIRYEIEVELITSRLIDK